MFTPNRVAILLPLNFLLTIHTTVVFTKFYLSLYSFVVCNKNYKITKLNVNYIAAITIISVQSLELHSGDGKKPRSSSGTAAASTCLLCQVSQRSL